MIQIGKDNILTVARQTLNGMYLEDEEGNEVLLPNVYVFEGLRIGDKVEVFIYHDSEDRIVATTLDPLLQVNQYGYLRVKQVNKFGAFLEWGLNKDLLVPFSNQALPMEEGNSYIVYLEQDMKTLRLVGNAKINKTFRNEFSTYEVGAEVSLLVFSVTDMGANVIIDDKYRGLLYKNEIFQPIQTGDKLTGYIKNVREDFKIDVTLHKPSYERIEPDSLKILEKLKANNGFLSLNDASSPELVKEKLQMSKKSFKRSIGLLYKNRQITFDENGIVLVTKK